MPHGPVPGLEGTLISPRAAGDWLRSQQSDAIASAATAVAQWAAGTLATLGPAASERRLLEELENLFQADLGCTCRRAGDCSVARSAIRRRSAPFASAAALFAFAWQRPLALESRAVVRATMEAGADWAVGFNGVSLGILDARPGSPRRVAAIRLEQLASRAGAAHLAAALLTADALSRNALADLIRSSDESSVELRHGLQDGVNDSLAALTRELSFDAGIAVLFRLLFVLFAEARSLVPVWHRVYRDHYSLSSLAARTLPRDARGVWASLEAGRRLLGSGCRAGTLQVTGFNGRLFEPTPARKWAASRLLDSKLDRPAADALASLTEYRPARGGARRVNYAELDVEELGSIYERVLDLDPAGEGRARKESGSFYTPRSLTSFVVRRTLAPLVADATSEQILSLRVVDPAMGSGAFLVAALHYLSRALEQALVSEGALPEGDVTETDRQRLRRLIAQHCLYGVDANPTAAMLAKLSLWLATLAGDKPLGFLDHRLKCGNSLVGIDPFDARHPPGTRPRETPLPLFDERTCAASLRAGAEQAARLASMTEDSLDDVKRKQKFFEMLGRSDAGLDRWRTLCDAWCAWWYQPTATRPDAREYGALADALVRHSRLLPRRGVERRLREVAAIASAQRFFHWRLEFPEVSDKFHAVIGNPPWEMLRAGSGSRGRETLKAFARGSGIYKLSIGGHVNLYQLFVERSLNLVRNGGRIGMVLPWGLMSDEGSTSLRHALLDGTSIDTLVRLDNSHGLFQAHRSLRFAALTTTVGAPTESFELTRIDEGAAALDDLPDAGLPRRGPVLTRRAIETLGGSARRIPDAANARLLAIAVKIASANLALGDPAGWGASFGRELNLTDDRAAFGAAGMPVIEGKHLSPFRVDAAAARHHISRAAACRLLPHRPFDRARLAYRDVTAATNRQTAIAAIVPCGVVTSHSVFCLRNEWNPETQHALCIILNSAVANFLVRLFVASHLTTSLIEWLPVPDRERAVRALGTLKVDDCSADEVDALVAKLYHLDAREFPV